MKKNEILIVISALIISLIIVVLTGDMQTGLYVSGAFLFGLMIFFAIFNYPLLGILFIIAYGFFSSLISIPVIESGGRLAGLLAVIGWFLKHFLKEDTVVFNQLKSNIFSLCFILCMFISSGFADQTMVSFQSAFVITLYIIMSFLIQDFIRDEKDIKVIVMTMAMSVGIGSLIALIQYWMVTSGGNIFGEIMYSETGELSRLGGFADAASYGALLMSGIPALLFLSLSSKKNYLKAICFLFFITSFISLVLSGARTHMYGFIVFLAAYLIFSIKYRIMTIKRIFLVTVVILFMVVLLSSFLMSFVTSRSMSLDDSSSETRFMLINKGISLLIEHPLFGIGLENLRFMKNPEGESSYYVESKDSHDVVSGVFAALGLPGSLLILAIFYKTLSSFNSAAQKFMIAGDNHYMLNLIVILKSAFIALLSTWLGDKIIFSNTVWLYTGLSAVIYRMSIMLEEKVRIQPGNIATDYLHIKNLSVANRQINR